jgi:hypothetical protein
MADFWEKFKFKVNPELLIKKSMLLLIGKNFGISLSIIYRLNCAEFSLGSNNRAKLEKLNATIDCDSYLSK